MSTYHAYEVSNLCPWEALCSYHALPATHIPPLFTEGEGGSDGTTFGLHLLGLAALYTGKSKHSASPEPDTFSRSGSSKPSANSLLSITEEAATSSGVDPLIDGEAKEGGKKERKRDQENTPR